MSSVRTNNSPLRAAAGFALALATLALTIRIAQLAHSANPTAPPAASGLARITGETHSTPAASRRSAELAEFYQACPMAAVVDLDTIAHSPEKVDAIFPPIQQTAAHVPAPPVEPAVPRIRYPVHVDTSNCPTAPGSAAGSELRVAAVPPIATNSPAAKSTATQGDWLIDPNEWLDTKAAQQPSPATVGGVSDAAPRSDANDKSASATPPTNNHDKESTQPSSQTPATIDSTRSSPLSPHSPPPSPAAADPIFSPPAANGKPTDEQLPTPSAPPAARTTAPNAPFAPPPASAAEASPPGAGAEGKSPAVDPHLEIFSKSAYPSARECAVCHEEIYEQWSMSAHAYAAVSPMFNKFEQRLNDLSQGTVGYFCMRCHSPVGTALCASRDTPLWQLPEAAREGITCVACHRVQYAYGKSNGERRIETGDIFAPVFGGIGGDGVADAIAEKDQLKVKTAPSEPGPGQNIHVTGIYFQPLTRSEFCTPCHQVAVYPGIKLEVVWEQYRASPACKKGIQCQDCHMGRVPGLPLGYDCGPVAKVAGKTVNDNRKKSNHIFFGPNYPIAHPGVFPFNLKANRWTMDQWLTFDWRAGWGTKEFEDHIANGESQCNFPPVWAEADDRLDAREIIDANLKKMELKRELRVQVMENGSKVEGPFFDSALRRGQDIDLHYIVTNLNDGHNLLTASLGAQPQLWGNVVLIGPDGQRIWETGYTDSAGDLANIHSYDVRNKRLPFDWQLFNLQTMFLITGAKGTDREFYVPVNLDIDQLPFIRPGTQPITVLNHPPFIRMESQSLAPLGSRKVPYRIPGQLIHQPGTYRLSFRLRSRSEPIYFMRFCGATEEMERSMNEWMIDVHPMSVEFEVR